MEEVRTIEEARSWFLTHHEGDVLCVRQDGTFCPVGSFHEAEDFLTVGKTPTPIANPRDLHLKIRFVMHGPDIWIAVSEPFPNGQGSTYDAALLDLIEKVESAGDFIVIPHMVPGVDCEG